MYGAKQAIECMHIKPRDRVVIVTDYKSKKISDAIAEQSRKIAPTEIFYLDNYGKRPLLSLPREIKDAAAESTAIFYTANQYKGEKHNLRKPLIKLIENNKLLREAHMPGITEQLMKEGMNVNYKKMQRFARKIYSIVRKAKEIRVITKAGSDFTASFDKNIKWLVADGNIKRGWSNLPDGEIFTCAKSLHGKIVADGSLGDYFQKYKVIEKTPIYIEIKNSRIASLKCKNKKLEREFLRYIRQDKNADRIGEFALGINTALKHLTGNLLQDEKFPGIHVAIGHGYPKETCSKWDSKAHCDLVLQHCTVFADGKMIMKNSKYIVK
jgi:leucyl aminopeptidase (aminopeptidase T)